MTDLRDEECRSAEAEDEKWPAETEHGGKELRGARRRCRRMLEEGEMMSDQVPPPGRPGREAEVLAALKEASRRNPRLVEEPPEEVTRQLMLAGLLREEPSPELVAEMMLELEVEEQEFDPDVQPGES